MRMFTFRHATRTDIPAIVRLWRQTRPYDEIEEESVRLFFENGKWFLQNAVLLVERDDNIMGFITGVIDGVKMRGGIPVFFLHPDCLGDDTGDRLLRRVMDSLRSRNAEVVEADRCGETGLSDSGYDSRYVDILDIFRRNGFESQDRYHELDVAIVKDLSHFELPAWVADARASLGREGFNFGFCTPEFHERYLSFMFRHFGGYSGWCHRAQQYVEGRREGGEFRVLALRDGEVVGFTECHKREDGSIYATGVREDLRRRRIGTVLVFSALEEMTRRGARRLRIGHAPYEFYKVLEGKVVYRFMRMKKKL
jgi:ribosomal protein S18 acetylase RimI-like enzyme